MSGTDIAYGLSAYAFPMRCPRVVLRACCTMPGTDLASAYARAVPRPVLSQRRPTRLLCDVRY
eukprot:641357-Rhodomonas_salina.2